MIRLDRDTAVKVAVVLGVARPQDLADAALQASITNLCVALPAVDR